MLFRQRRDGAMPLNDENFDTKILMKESKLVSRSSFQSKRRFCDASFTDVAVRIDRQVNLIDVSSSFLPVKVHILVVRSANAKKPKYIVLDLRSGARGACTHFK